MDFFETLQNMFGGGKTMPGKGAAGLADLFGADDDTTKTIGTVADIATMLASFL